MNPYKKKKLTNIHTSNQNNTLLLTPILTLTLKQTIKFLNLNKYLKITPTSIKIKKLKLTQQKHNHNIKHHKTKYIYTPKFISNKPLFSKHLNS